LLIDSGKRVLCAGLDLDFRGVPFGSIPTLLAIADTITKLSSICTACGTDAHFSQRLINDVPAKFHDPIIMVGAQESYQARCRSCFSIDQKPQW
jgi:thymidine kinase